MVSASSATSVMREFALNDRPSLKRRISAASAARERRDFDTLREIHNTRAMAKARITPEMSRLRLRIRSTSASSS